MWSALVSTALVYSRSFTTPYSLVVTTRTARRPSPVRRGLASLPWPLALPPAAEPVACGPSSASVASSTTPAAACSAAASSAASSSSFSLLPSASSSSSFSRRAATSAAASSSCLPLC